MTKQLYIAYGLNVSKKSMQRRCQTANPIAVATLPGYQLVFQCRASGVRANIIPAHDQEVPVVIWEITDKDEHRLDVYEGLEDGCCTKELLEIDVSGERVEALAYIWEPRPYGVPNDPYLRTMAEGYLDFDLPIKALNDAIHHAYVKTVTNGASLRPAQ